jgi:DNA replication licensing factor MCM6
MDSNIHAVNIRDDGEEDANTYFTPEELDHIQDMRKRRTLFDDLIQSIAPAVYGHRDIKCGILLMLFGGVHKKTHEGINLRGDINVCIVGDPSCAKSQFLKYV